MSVRLTALGTECQSLAGPLLLPLLQLIQHIPLRDGDIFVADGHQRPANDRNMKFDKNDKYLMEWGQNGTGPNDIGIPHGLAIDKEGRIYVADRSNKAVKVLRQERQVAQRLAAVRPAEWSLCQE